MKTGTIEKLKTDHKVFLNASDKGILEPNNNPYLLLRHTNLNLVRAIASGAVSVPELAVAELISRGYGPDGRFYGEQEAGRLWTLTEN